PFPNHSIEQRMIIDRAITFAKKKLERNDYSKFQLEIVKVLAEGDNLNMAEEILLTSISEDHSEFYYAESLLAMADILLRKSFWSNSNNLIDEAKEVFTKLDNNICLAKCENSYGTSYGERGEVQLAKNHFLKGIDLLKNSVDEKLEAELETALAIIENICGNLDVSKEHFYKALHTFEKLNEQKRIAELYHNIGMLYLELEEYEKAVNEFDK
ncbi:MAG: tetratricopeptide repeat protein, partial [Ignavibacteriaceae bacterium]